MFPQEERMDVISLKGEMTLELLKKSRYFGSHKGMRFRLSKEEEQLQATVYPEPYSWEYTPKEQKEPQFFPFSEEGLDQAVAWLNQKYREDYKKCTDSK